MGRVKVFDDSFLSCFFHPASRHLNVTASVAQRSASNSSLPELIGLIIFLTLPFSLLAYLHEGEFWYRVMERILVV